MNTDVKNITPAELKKILHEKDIVLLDVREEWERDEYHIGGIHIPVNELMERMKEIPTDKEVVVYCRKGIRSQVAIQRLQQKGCFKLLNLEGGIEKWKKLSGD